MADNTKSNSKKEIGITLIGTRGVGKTCFLASLATFDRSPIDSVYNLNPIGEVSCNYFNNLREKAEKREKPDATGNCTSLEYELTTNNKTQKYRITDYQGEKLRETVVNGQSFEKSFIDEDFLKNMGNSEIILLFIDSEKIESLKGNAQESNESKEFLKSLRASIQAITNAYSEYESKHPKELIAPKNRELYVVLTKADTNTLIDIIDNEDKIRKYVRDRLKKFGTNLRNATSKVASGKLRYFAFSAFDGKASSEPQNENMVEFNPKGLKKILDTIGTKRERDWIKKIKKTAIISLSVPLILASIVLTSCFLYDREIRDRIQSPDTTTSRLLALRPCFKKTKSLQDDKLNQRFQKYQQDIQNAHAPEDVTALLGDYEQFNSVHIHNESFKHKVDDLIAEAKERKEYLEYERIKKNSQDNKAKLEQIINFIANNPGSSERILELERTAQKIKKEIVLDLIQAIMSKEAKNKVMLRQKLDDVKLLTSDDEGKKVLDEDNFKSIQNAISVADRIIGGDNNHRVKIINYGKFQKSSYGNEVNLEIKVKGETILSHKPNGDITESNPNKEYGFNANFGDNIVIELFADPTVWEGPRLVARFTGKDFTILNGQIELNATPEGEDYKDPDKGYYLNVKLDDFKDEEISSFRKYMQSNEFWSEIAQQLAEQLNRD